MLEWIFDRAYRRNKTLMEKLGVGYTPTQHADYMASMTLHGLKPMSIKGHLLAHALAEPYAPKRCDFYTFEEAKPGKGFVGPSVETTQSCKKRSTERAEAYVLNHASDVQRAVVLLSEQVDTPLALTYALTLDEVVVRRSDKQLTCHRDVAIVPHLAWTATNVNSGAKALVI